MMELPLYYIISFIKNKKESKKDSAFKDIVLESSDNKHEETEQLSKTKKIILLGFPFIFDMISSNIGFFFLIMIPGNIYNMLKGVLLIIITFLISKYYLKNKHNLDQYISFIISIIGFILIGLSTFLGEEEDDDDEDKIEMSVGLYIVSYLVIFFAMFLLSTKFCIEEYYMKKYSFHPLLFIGTEGLFGLVFNIILCIILYYIKCGSDPSEFLQDLCIKDGNGIWRVKNIIFAFEQIMDNYKILIYIIIFTLFLFAFNIIGIYIIKFGGAMPMSLVENVRAFFIWIYFLLPWVSDELDESFNWIRLIGLIFIFGSIIIYYWVLKFEERRRLKKQLRAISQIEDFYENTNDCSLEKSIVSFEDNKE